MWPRSPAVERERLEGDITRVLAEKRALHIDYELAGIDRQHGLDLIEASQTETDRIRGCNLVVAAEARRSRCLRLIEEREVAIGMLQDELDELLPRQREGD